MPEATTEDFDRLDIRVGRVVRVEPFPRAHKPAYKLWIDFGPLGLRQSSARITKHYAASDLQDRLVVAVTNFPPRNVGGFRSDVLVLGALEDEDGVVLLVPERAVPPGLRIR